MLSLRATLHSTTATLVLLLLLLLLLLGASLAAAGELVLSQQLVLTPAQAEPLWHVADGQLLSFGDTLHCPHVHHVADIVALAGWAE